MGMTQKQWRIAFGVVLGLIVAIVVAGVIAILVILLSSENFCDTPASLPRFLHISENEGNVRIQWAQSIFACKGSYLLQYSINGGQQIQIFTEDIQHIVIKPPVCSDMLIQLRTVGEAGRTSEESLNQDYTVLPLNAFVTNTAITRTDIGRIASWEEPLELKTCDITYAVRFTSELGQFDEQTASKSIIVPEHIFCFNLRVQVSSIVGFSETLLWDVGHVIAESIRPDLSIPSENPFILIATWSHKNEDICALSYGVLYQFGTESETSVVVEPRVTFDVRYCVSATLSILPNALGGEHTGWLSSTSATQYPDNMVLQPVQNVEFLIDDISVAVSWDIHEALSRCSNLYTVTARNNYLGEEASCQGTSGCAVTLSNFCPSTDFIINPKTLQGESVHKTYTC